MPSSKPFTALDAPSESSLGRWVRTASMRIVNVAGTKAKEMDKLVEARLLEDWSRRKVEVR